MRTEEDEAFDEIERKQQRQRVIDDDDTMCYRNDVIEEVAACIEQFTFAFGVDTVHSFAAFVRGMKR